MSEPFEFLDEEEEDDKASIAWLPLTLATLALAGFLLIPLLGFFRSERNSADWSNYSQSEGLQISVEPAGNFSPITESLEPLLTPDPEDLREDLMSVDETLASLGENYVPAASGKEKSGFSLSVEQPASDVKYPAGNSKPEGQVPGLKKTKALKTGNELTNATAKRIPQVQRPTVANVAAQAARASEEITVQPGDTLYGIARSAGSTTEEIARMNGINPNSPIRAGQKLRVPRQGNSQNSGLSDNTALRRQAPSQVALARETVLPQQAPKTVRPAPQSPVYGEPVYGYPGSTGVSPFGSQFYPENQAIPGSHNPLDQYKNAVAYRVQPFDNLNRIADALATTPEELIRLNGRSTIKNGEMLVVPVDNCMVKDN